MKLSEYKTDYYQYTSLASNGSRQLALAGIALVWVFKTQGASGYTLPNELLIPSIALIVSLGSDLLQYVAGSVTWGIFHRYHEAQRASMLEDPELEAPVYYTWPINAFFYSKILSVLIAYFYLLKYAISSVSFG